MRNYFCPEYNRCLDSTIRTGKQDFSCDRCKSRGSKTFTSDMIGECLLLWAVFRPELYRLYKQAEKINDKAALMAFQERNRKGGYNCTQN